MKRVVVVSVIVCAAISIAHSTRAFIPGPSYVLRLRLLNGWSSRGYYGFNCSGLIANAHGEHFQNERQMYAGNAKLHMIKDFSDRYHVDEAQLQPGDVAAYQGPAGFNGMHVAAYLGNGVWIDSDSRRGYVAEYHLKDVPANDPWFMGRVHIMRWTSSTHVLGNPHFFAEEAVGMQ
jgi:cell wall-associated NlpC family hydrolase